MEDSSAEKTCATHRKPYQFICLDEECKQKFLLCQACRQSNTHKHSRTAIEDIKEVQSKLNSMWELKDNKMEGYYKKVRFFYDKLRKDVNELLNEDQKIVESLLEKISYHHLPIEANSLCYLEFKKQQYERLDKSSILKLITEADSGELNRNLDQQKQILNLLDVEVNKGQQKLMTIKYVLLSKKMQAQLLTPKLPEVSKVCTGDDMCKVYGLFNSKNMLIRQCNLRYRASQAKFSPKEFFNSCNNLPNCVALVKLQNGRKVGGFSSIPLVHPLEEDQMKQEGVLTYQQDKTKRSFIFSLTNIASFDVKNSSKAIAFKKNASGPIFGLDLNLSSLKAESNLGNSYQQAQGVHVDSLEAKVYLLGVGQANISQMQIWQLCF